MSVDFETGWFIIERSHWPRLEPDVDQPDGTLIEIHPDVASRALLVEMQRPPWYRDLDREKKALAKELA